MKKIVQKVFIVNILNKHLVVRCGLPIPHLLFSEVDTLSHFHDMCLNPLRGWIGLDSPACECRVAVWFPRIGTDWRGR